LANRSNPPPLSGVSLTSISAETASTLIDDETMNVDDDETIIDDNGSVHELNDDSMDFSFGGKKKSKKTKKNKKTMKKIKKNTKNLKKTKKNKRKL